MDPIMCAAQQIAALALSRARNSLPVLKIGTCFSATGTPTPVRGLRPMRASLCLTENVPKPRNSTRFGHPKHHQTQLPQFRFENGRLSTAWRLFSDLGTTASIGFSWRAASPGRQAAG
jgi:hypothetical protein